MTTEQAVIKLHSWPEWLSLTERKIINRLITAALNAGCLIEVLEGEDGEQMVAPTVNRRLIQRNTAATGITLYALHKDGTYQGTFVLIHGNEEDVVSDYSWPRSGNSEFMDSINNRLMVAE